MFAVLLALSVLEPREAAAAAAAADAPAALTTMTIESAPTGEAKVTFVFDQVLPPFSVLANDAPRAVLSFVGAVRGSGAAIPLGAHGLVRTIDVAQHDGVLTLSIVADQPIHISTAPAAGLALVVTVTAVPAAETGPRAQGPPPKHRADADPDEVFEVVPLKFADVSEIAGLLTSAPGVRPNDFFSPQEPAFGAAGVGGSFGGQSGAQLALTQGAQGPPQDLALGQTVDDAVGLDRRLNAVILKGSPERVRRLKAQVELLDRPVASVVLETVFVELTETGARNVGIDYANANNQIGLVSYRTGAFAASGSADAGRIGVSVQAAVYDQVNRGNGRIISRPRISAQSGASAKIVTGDALPILTAITLSGVNGVSQQVQYVNVGVTLQIAPRVSADGVITAHIFCAVSSATGFSQGYPTISQREASTTATVRDGQSFIIGGLTQENDVTSRGRTPGPGDVPVLGSLFRVDAHSRSKADLYIVVTPRIVGDGDHALAAKILSDLGVPAASAPARP